MTNRLGFMGETTVISVSDAAPEISDRFTPGGPDPSRYRYMLTASADCNIEVNNDAVITITALIKGNLPYEIMLNGIDTLSYVTADTATLYITKIG